MFYFVPCNWRQVKAREGPSIERIETLGKRRRLRNTEVALALDPRSDICELRDWLMRNAKNRFIMFGLYRILRRTWEIRGEYAGVAFSFIDIKDAVHFKLAWYNNEPTFKD